MKNLRKLSTVLGILFILFLFSCPIMAQSSSEITNFPASYDLRDLNGKNYVTPVKFQNPFGTCWAHAAIACAETNSMLKGGSSNIDLSEKALAWYSYQYQGAVNTPDDELEGIYGFKFDVNNELVGFQEETNIYNNGGNILTATNQLSTWLGSSTEAQIPYVNSTGDYNNSSSGLVPSSLGDWSLDYYGIYNNAYHLQNSELIPGTENGTSDEEFVPKTKELIMNNRALMLAYHATSGKKVIILIIQPMLNIFRLVKALNLIME